MGRSMLIPIDDKSRLKGWPGLETLTSASDSSWPNNSRTLVFVHSAKLLNILTWK